MIFDPISDKKIKESVARQVVDNGKFLGRSHYEKDCYWACYEYKEKYYISLNDDCDSMWEADSEDIDNYNEVIE